MSTQDGIQILQSSKANENELILCVGQVFQDVSGFLKRGREIPEKSYNKASRLIEKMSETPAIYLHRTFNCDAKRRFVEFRTLALFPKKSDPNCYVPWVNRISLGPCHLYTGMRLLPIELNSEGLEFKHLRQDATLLEYDDPDFARMILTAALLCKDKTLPPGGESCVNIPLNSGVVYGHAQCPPEIDMPDFVGIGCLLNPKKKTTYVEKEPWFKDDQWGIGVKLTSYFGQMNLHSYQMDLYRAYQSTEIPQMDIRGVLDDLVYVLTTIAPPEPASVERLKSLGKGISHLSFLG